MSAKEVGGGSETGHAGDVGVPAAERDVRAERGERLITLARFGAPHGIGGLIRAEIFSRTPQFFAAAAFWWCRPRAPSAPAASPAAPLSPPFKKMALERCTPHGGKWLVKLADINTREAAAGWCNGSAALPYSQLPPLPKPPHGAAESFYWCDLLGMQVQNAARQPLGVVEQLMDIGAHDVLRVKTAGGGALLIPFVEKHVLQVDIAARQLTVEWESDW